MTKNTYITTLPYKYTNNPRSHYLIAGSKEYKNHGELMECIAKEHRGLFISDKNPATRFDVGSDIEEIHASVKSSAASLACLYGETFTKVVREYFATVHSTVFMYVDLNEDTNEVVEYIMNKREFGAFLQKFGYLHYESGHREKQKIRIRATSQKMIAWFEERIG